MYYPYLRGRQFELIALREYALQRGDKNNIIPIIEPVKKTFNSMKLALPKLIEGNVKFSLILNPQVGEINNVMEIINALDLELSDRSRWIPTFILTNNFNEVSKYISENNYIDVMIILTDTTDTSSNDFNQFIESPLIKYIVTKENKTLKRRLRTKDFILLNDNFKAQKRNSDYLAMPEEKFTEEHLFYAEENYCGFSDYTVLVSDFIEGGAAPYAVAIHLTYEKENDEIWIRHFASITNDDQSNIQGKFEEASKKAVIFLDSKNIHTNASEELRNYYHTQSYPGLGMVKKISIKNHLEVLNNCLNSVK
ncbi:MAG: sce7725 family protein [Paludibacter sp.]|nr:sce7725 family protein [Paludibacter sp.]